MPIAVQYIFRGVDSIRANIATVGASVQCARHESSTRVRREERTDAPVEESSEKYARPRVTVINHPRSYSGDLFRFLLARRRSAGYPREAERTDGGSGGVNLA